MTARLPATTRGRVTLAGCVVAALVAAGAGTWAAVDLGSAPASAEQPAAHRGTTAEVTKGDLTDERTFAGSLGYGASTPLAGAAPGTLTWLPATGDVVRRDGQLYAVDEHPVRSMHGDVPLYRALARGLKGKDVAQLNQNLAALGYDVAVDDTFGSRTERAVRQYRKDRGMEKGATLGSSDIAFVPGDLRVGTVSARVGGQSGGDLYETTGTRRVVTVTASEKDGSRFRTGADVTARVNGQPKPIPGTITAVETAKDDAGKSVVTATVELGTELPDTVLDGTGAQVLVTGDTVKDVLSVPVSALRAGTGDGYAVDVVRGGAARPVQVEVGIVAGDRVEVRGDLRAGDRVEVPA